MGTGFQNGLVSFDYNLITTTSGDNNNVPTMGTLNYVIVSNNLDAITGIDVGTSEGFLIFVVNVGPTNNLVIKNNNANSLATNRILTSDGLDLTVRPFYTAVLGYDTINSVWHVLQVPQPARSFNNSPGRSIVTGTGATGFQVSSTRDSIVNYSVNIVTTATIAGGQDGMVLLEIAPTNSATPGDWVEVGRSRNGQALSLALTLQSVQTVAGQVGAVIPAGYYAKLRSVNNTGTPSYAFNSGQEVLI